MARAVLVSRNANNSRMAGVSYANSNNTASYRNRNIGVRFSLFHCAIDNHASWQNTQQSLIQFGKATEELEVQ